MKINNREIGDGYPVFITFEAGATHSGLESAKLLAWQAKEAGGDAIKFQMTDADRILHDKDLMFEYEYLVSKPDKMDSGREVVTGEKLEKLYDILKRTYMAFDGFRELKKYCDNIGIIFFSTAMFEDEVDFLVDIGCDTIKICSGDIDLYDFIKYVASKKVCVQIDTGNAELWEVEKAVKLIETKSNRIIIHHCPSGYPARLESINLNMITTLKQVYNYPIAFSDHTPGWDMDIGAVALGANMVEKTITLDKYAERDEHMFSLEFDEMKRFVASIRKLEVAMGKSRKIISEKERRKNLKSRRQLRNGVYSRPRCET